MKGNRSSDDTTHGTTRAGARNDDSSLFSLAALKRREATLTAPGQEDSGLIDLKALAALDANRGSAPKLEVAPFAPTGLFELPAPPAPPPEPAPPPAPRPGSARLIVAAAAVAVVAVGAIAAARWAGGSTPAAAAEPPPTVIPSTAAPSGEPAAEAAPPAKPPVTTEASARPTVPPVRIARPPRGAGSGAPRVQEAKKVAPKPVDNCDLHCQMQRSVSKGR